MLTKTTTSLMAGLFVAGASLAMTAQADSLCMNQCAEDYNAKMASFDSFRGGSNYSTKFGEASNCFHVCTDGCETHWDHHDHMSHDHSGAYFMHQY